MMRKLAALAAFLVLVLVQVAVPATAGATDAERPSGGPRIEDKNDPIGNVNDNPPGPDREWDPPPPPYVYRTQIYNPDPTIHTVNLCGPRADGSPALGHVIRFVRVTMVEDGYECIYRAETTKTPVACVLMSVISVYGPKENSGILRTWRVPSAWSTDTTNPDKCGDSVSQSVSMRLGTLGRFRTASVSALISCKLINYADNRASVIGECASAPYNKAPSNPTGNKVQVWCDDWSQDWTTGNPHTFTMDECKDRVIPKFKCKVSSVRLDGHLVGGSGVGVLDNGRKHEAVWTETELVRGPGLDHDPFRNVVPAETKVTVSGTPSRGVGVAQDATNQKYQAPGAGWKNWVDDSILLRWYAPSMSGAPWVLKRTVSYNAQYESPVVTITKMDLETGRVTPGPPESSWKDEHGECESADLKVTVKRARNVR